VLIPTPLCDLLLLLFQGFPLTVCPDAMLEIAQYAASHDRLFSMNLSAPFLCTAFKEPMMKLLPYVDVLFGNELVGNGHEFFLASKQIIIKCVRILMRFW
jgi:sugar/nucleoside kinase (ribokinase family)